mgnify:CR=1 FL=1
MAVLTTQVAAASQLTGAEIIDQGLELGGNTALVAQAKVFLNSFMDHLYRARDWEFLLRSFGGSFTTGGGGVSSFAVSSRYRAIDSVILVGEDQGELKQADFKWLWKHWKMDTEKGITGTPTHYAANQLRGVNSATPAGADGSGEYWLWPIPDKSYEYKTLAYLQPDLFSDEDFFPLVGSTDGPGRYPEFPDAFTLVNAVADFAANYERDTIQQVLQRNVAGALKVAIGNADDAGRGRPQQLRFDPTRWAVWRGDS